MLENLFFDLLEVKILKNPRDEHIEKSFEIFIFLNIHPLDFKINKLM